MNHQTDPAGMPGAGSPSQPVPVPARPAPQGPPVAAPVPYGAPSTAGPSAPSPAQPWLAPGPPLATAQPPTGASQSSGGRLRPIVWMGLLTASLGVGLLGGVIGASLQNQHGGGNGLLQSSVRTTPVLAADNTSIAAVARELLPSTVQILAEAGENSGTGSGFVLDDRDHVVTNNHVVAAAAEKGTIEVVDSSGESYPATIVGRSTVYDLAVLEVGGGADLEPAVLGTSADLLVGEDVVAFGAPLGLNQTVTAGIVSALNRPVTTGETRDASSFINAVQTDAAINPGNSGGPLVDLRGRVVGVNSAIATTGGSTGEAGSIGVGFAIPVEQVVTTVDQILRDGEATYPVIGATVDTSEGSRKGARIDAVRTGGAAETAGLEEGDLVTEVEGVRVTDGIQLIVQIRTHQPGDRVALTVTSGGKERTVVVTLESEVG